MNAHARISQLKKIQDALFPIENRVNANRFMDLEAEIAKIREEMGKEQSVVFRNVKGQQFELTLSKSTTCGVVGRITFINAEGSEESVILEYWDVLAIRELLGIKGY